jgi:hypothetical protein
MNRLIVTCVILACAAPALVAQSPLTKIVPVDCWGGPFGMCYVQSGRDGSPTADWSVAEDFTTERCDVPAQIPAGSKIFQVVARAYMADSNPFDGVISTVDVNINGVALGFPQTLTTSAFHCNATERLGTYVYDTGFSTSGHSWYRTEGALNTLELHVPYAETIIEAVDLEIRYLPPPPFEIQFDITDSTPAEDRRVLLSNMNVGPAGFPNYTYPRFQGFLSRDKMIPVAIRTLVDGVGTAGIPVTLEIADPADPSPYMATVLATGQQGPGSNPNDNVGPRPTLTGAGVIDNGNGTYSVTSGANGHIDVTMELSVDAVAGDNYQVVARSTQHGTVTTATSGTITAWKRLFVEKRHMFRRGAMLATNAPVGVTNIVVPAANIASAGETEFRRNDWLLLTHAPWWGEAKHAGAFYTGLYQLTRNPERFRAQVPASGPGTVTTNGSVHVVGNRTRFNQLKSGDVLTIGPDVRVVVQVIDATHVTLDAPTTTSAAGQAYDIGDPALTPGVRYLRLALSRPLTERYGREPIVNPQAGLLLFNDAVVALNAAGITPTDYFDVDHSQLTGTQPSKAFPDAYTEYVVLPTLPAVAVNPLPRTILNSDHADTQRFIDKWFSLPRPEALPSNSPNLFDWFWYPVQPNHQLVLVADTTEPDVSQSGSNGFLCLRVPGERASVLNRGTVEYMVGDEISPLNQADAGAVLKRTMVHEIAHQWWLNDPTFGHQDHCVRQVAYDSTTSWPTSGTPPPGLRFCLMVDPNDGTPTMTAPWHPHPTINMVMYMYRNGHTAFHITRPQQSSPWHSEYLVIRRTSDPWRPR